MIGAATGADTRMIGMSGPEVQVFARRSKRIGVPESILP
jgi:hypothetical protein